VDRNDLREVAAGDVLAADVDEVEPPGCGSTVASVPHPAQNLSGSVRKAKTVAGGAAIWTSRRTTSGSVIGSLLLQERSATVHLGRVF